MADRFDVAIIGGGVVGCAIARELARYAVRTVVFEKEADVARGTSGKNSGVVHTGINVPPGSLKAKLNVAGAAMFEEVCRQLDVPFKRVGKLVVAREPDQIDELRALAARGRANGVPDLEIVDERAIRRMEPHITGCAALHAPTAAITCPYTLNIAFAESAVENGVDIRLEAPVTRISGGPGNFRLTTPGGTVSAQLVVNSAGLAADRVAAMAGVHEYRVYPCRGEYLILDRARGGMITRMVYPVPPKNGPGLGVHITPTVDGNILLGPTAAYIRSRRDARTTARVRRQLLIEAAELLPGIGPRDVITAYSGIRPKLVPASVGGFGDFVVEESPAAPGMMQLVGIESPGLTAAPAIALMVADWVKERLSPPANPRFAGGRHGARRFRELELREQAELVACDPDYGNVVCRCELVTRRELIAAIENPLAAVSLNAIKYRSRAMMGRCQGGFCAPRVVDMLLERGYPPEAVTQFGGDSALFTGTAKGLRAGRRPSRPQAVESR